MKITGDEYATPPWVVEAAQTIYRCKFDLDACATFQNRKCDRYFSKYIDGLSQPWPANWVWCNPPYSEPHKWVNYAIEQVEWGFACNVVLLLKADTSARWFHTLSDKADMHLLSPRIKFMGAKGSPPWGSMFAHIWPSSIARGLMGTYDIKKFKK